MVERSFLHKGRRIAARCWHDPSLPPLLALHGWQDNAATFDRLAPLLSGFHVVAMDFAGHGFSDWRAAGMRYHTMDHVDDVLAVVSQLEWDRFALVGHSMGAGVGSLFAGAMPERVSRFVMIDGLGPYAGRAEDAPAILREALLEWQAFESRPDRVFPDRETAVLARQRGFTPLSKEAAEILCSRSLKEVEGGFAWTMDRRIRHHSSLRLTESQVRAFLAAIEADVMVIRAEQGFPADPAVFDGRLAALKRLELQQVKGAHHLHLDESPYEVAALINRFLHG
ncbi:MAG TPA: alpha/beta hydrolase [Candidatus Kapabacteria bacterium]|nr:alpha/beta hydrolase [Candidatus Kapabacteria bacterium]